MNLTKQQKILAAVAVLGLGAVAVDRLVLGPPQSASASAASDVAPAPAARPADDLEPGSEPPRGAPTQADTRALPSFASLTERLELAPPVDPGAAGQDPFRLPDAWVPQAVQEVQTVQSEQSASSELLLRQYVLDGTFRSVSDQNQEQVAVINGRAMRVGERILVRTGASSDGVASGEVYELLKVATRAVVFESVQTGRQVVLRAPKVLD
jgi:hypothetical protein